MPDDGSLVTRRPAQAAAELRELSLKPGIFIDEAEAVNRALNRTLISPRLVQRSGTKMFWETKEFGPARRKTTFASSSPCMGLGLSSGIFEPAPLSFGAARGVLDSIEHGASIAQKGTTTRVIRVAPVA
jgi:hypothetical protein